MQSKNTSKYGCFIMEKVTNKLLHHAEKPNTFISDLINCGIYLFNKNYKQVFKEARALKINEIS